MGGQWEVLGAKRPIGRVAKHRLAQGPNPDQRPSSAGAVRTRAAPQQRCQDHQLCLHTTDPYTVDVEAHKSLPPVTRTDPWSQIDIGEHRG